MALVNFETLVLAVWFLILDATLKFPVSESAEDGGLFFNEKFRGSFSKFLNTYQFYKKLVEIIVSC